jgi:HEAT repeat protein
MDKVDELIQELNNPDSTTRDRAAEKLGKLGDARAVEPLLLALEGLDWRLRGYAAWALGELGDPKAGDKLLNLLDDPVGDVQQSVRHALAKLNDQRLIPRLISELFHEQEWARYESAILLGRIGNESALPELDRLAKTHKRVRTDIDVRKSAQEAALKIRQRIASE